MLRSARPALAACETFSAAPTINFGPERDKIAGGAVLSPRSMTYAPKYLFSHISSKTPREVDDPACKTAPPGNLPVLSHGLSAP